MPKTTGRLGIRAELGTCIRGWLTRCSSLTVYSLRLDDTTFLIRGGGAEEVDAGLYKHFKLALALRNTVLLYRADLPAVGGPATARRWRGVLAARNRKCPEHRILEVRFPR